MSNSPSSSVNVKRLLQRFPDELQIVRIDGIVHLRNSCSPCFIRSGNQPLGLILKRPISLSYRNQCQLICCPNQLTGFYMRETLIVSYKSQPEKSDVNIKRAFIFTSDFFKILRSSSKLPIDKINSKNYSRQCIHTCFVLRHSSVCCKCSENCCSGRSF